ncbi:transcription factor E2F8 isoform X2 [Falco peregrinus]|uniref:transcription factor E2F8 isoform X2 n=1 Tax=Falco peregrinus TaxID=8954 RepID=UPI0024798E41|nr:transcription factor E2F8 isoform X2 [Falco peregrinus]
MFKRDPGRAPPTAAAAGGQWAGRGRAVGRWARAGREAGGGRSAAGSGRGGATRPAPGSPLTRRWLPRSRRTGGPCDAERRGRTGDRRLLRLRAGGRMQQAGREMGTGDKENHPPELCRSALRTPLKQGAASPSVLAEIQPGCQPLATPPKPQELLPTEPWTPTANLKMLISAASPEIRSRERRRELSNTARQILQAKHCLPEHLPGDEYEKSQPSRKEKSLGLLCHKFLARYTDHASAAADNFICLDEVAEELNVERRRIYDIVNVLESLHMVSRLAKNKYAWHGRHNLSKTLQALKRVGEENKYTQQIQMIKKREYEHEFDLSGERNEEMARSFGSNDHSEMSFVELPGMEFRAASVNSRKDKSLRVMSQKFVMLFLVSTPKIVSLEVAAKILIGEDQLEDLDKSKFKTKIRRLYDIANVLSSLELIKKVHVTEERGRKPAFKWTGPEILPNIQDTKLEPVSMTPPMSESIPSKEQCSKNLFPSKGKQNFTRHPSLIKLVKSIENDRRKIQSAPTSPVKISPSMDQNLSAFPSKMAQLPAVAKHQLEGQSKKATEMKLSRPALQCSLSSPAVAPSQQPALTQLLGVCPPSHSSVSPVILPHAPSGVSYAIYLHPSQAHTVTTYSPSIMLQPLPCANVTGINSEVLHQITTEGRDNQIAARDPTKSLTAKERPSTKSQTSSQRCLKRSQALPENNLIKRYRSDEESLDTSLGVSMKNERPSSSSSQTNYKMDNVQEERQNKTETLDQNMASCYDQCKREDVLEGEDKSQTKQDIPVTLAIPAHETFFPSGYLIPLTQCTQGNKAGFLNKEKAGICSVQHTSYSSPITGVIPVPASELKAVNIPAFHVTPLNIMLSPTSIAAAPVLSNSCLNSSNTCPAQSPRSSVLNFTLQHVGLIPAGVQVPANPVLQHVPVSSQPKSVSHGSENTNLQEEEPSIPKESHEPQRVTENFFRTPGGPNTVSSPSANSDGANQVSQGTLYIPQRRLEVSED